METTEPPHGDHADKSQNLDILTQILKNINELNLKMDKTESIMNNEIAQIKAQLPKKMSWDDRTEIEVVEAAMRKLIENMDIPVIWNEDNSMKLGKQFEIIVIGRTPSIFIVDNVHSIIHSLNRNISSNEFTEIMPKRYENYNLVVEQKLSNKCDIVTQFIRLKKFIDAGEDGVQLNKIFLKNHHFSSFAIQLMNKITANEIDECETLFKNSSGKEDNPKKIEVTNKPQQLDEENNHFIVGHLNPPNRIFNETFYEYSNRVELFLISNRIPKPMWTNFIYSALNSNERDKIDAERFITNGEPSTYNDIVKYLSIKELKRPATTEFNSFERNTSISVQNFFTKLRHLCNLAYPQKTTEEKNALMVHQFLKGVNNEKISRKLFQLEQENNVDLQTALKIAIKIEEEDNFIRQLKQKDSEIVIHHIKSKTKLNSYTGECKRCLKNCCSYHVKDPGCKWCKMNKCIEHQGYRKPKERRALSKPREKYPQNSSHRQVNNAEMIRDLEESEFGEYEKMTLILPISKIKSENGLSFIYGLIDGVSIRVLIDSGAEKSLISSKCRRSIKPIESTECNEIFGGISGTRMMAKEKIAVKLELSSEFTIPVTFTVLDNIQHDAILGEDVLRKFNISIDYERNRLISINNVEEVCNDTDIAEPINYSRNQQQIIPSPIYELLRKSNMLSPPDGIPPVKHSIDTGTADPITVRQRRYSQKEIEIIQDMT
ncbi:hypothetical protein SNEBB_011417, partial [Seison nebaliae]